jgi:hypothetical protein
VSIFTFHHNNRLNNMTHDCFFLSFFLSPLLSLQFVSCIYKCKVIVGATKRYSLDNGSLKKAESIRVVDAISHPQFGEGTGINYDYALILLETEYIIESDIKLKLNFNSNFPAEGSDLDVLGMGTTSSGASDVASILRDVKVPAITNAECKNNYGSSSVTPKMLCAGYPKGGKDSCQGDSGGPLVKINGNVHTQVGIVSWGAGCALAGKPGVYSRVSEEISWMRKVICDDWKVGSDLCDGYTPAPPAPPPTCDLGRSSIKLVFKFDTYSEDISWKVTDFDNSNTVIDMAAYSVMKSNAEEAVSVCNGNCYTVKINDSFGDGLCCAQGNGGYEIVVKGKKVLTGGQFLSEATEKICLDKNGNFVGDGGGGDDPTEPPSDVATEDCEDRPKYLWKNKNGRHCKWVGKGNFKKRVRKCKRKDPGTGKRVMHFCPDTCAAVGKGPCAR